MQLIEHANVPRLAPQALVPARKVQFRHRFLSVRHHDAVELPRQCIVRAGSHTREFGEPLPLLFALFARRRSDYPERIAEELCIAVCRNEEPSEDFSVLIFGKRAHRQEALLSVHALKRLRSRFVYHIASNVPVCALENRLRTPRLSPESLQRVLSTSATSITRTASPPARTPSRPLRSRARAATRTSKCPSPRATTRGHRRAAPLARASASQTPQASSRQRQLR